MKVRLAAIIDFLIPRNSNDPADKIGPMDAPIAKLDPTTAISWDDNWN